MLIGTEGFGLQPSLGARGAIVAFYTALLLVTLEKARIYFVNQILLHNKSVHVHLTFCHLRQYAYIHVDLAVHSQFDKGNLPLKTISSLAVSPDWRYSMG